LTIFDTGKGLELIPAKPIEVIIGLPPYEERSGKNPTVGWSDWPFLLVKYRLFSANEENGNYIVTPTVAFTAPTGSNAFSTKTFGITPNIANGKGWATSMCCWISVLTFQLEIFISWAHRFSPTSLSNINCSMCYGPKSK